MQFFTDLSVTQGRVLAPLGIEAIGQRIVAESIFPGITGGLVHPQYFSFMSWVVKACNDAQRDRRKPETFIVWRKRLEQLWRLCSLIHDRKVRGVIGVQRVGDVFDAEAHDLDLEVNAHAFQPAAYGASLRLLGLATFGPQSSLQLTAAGEHAAAAFSQALHAGISIEAQATLDQVLSGTSKVSGNELRALSANLHLRSLSPGEPEFEPLLGTIVTAGNSPSPMRLSAKRRARGFGLLMSVIDKANTPMSSIEDVLEVLWLWAPDQRGEIDFLGAREAWRCYCERQELKMALVSFWDATLKIIDSRKPVAVPGEMIISRCVEAIISSEFLADIVPNVARCEWKHFVEKVTQKRSFTNGTLRAQRYKLAREIQHKDADMSTADRLGRALVLLACSAGCWNADERHTDEIALRHHGLGHERLSLPWLATQLTERSTKTVSTVVEWIVERCILQQATFVGYSKLPFGAKLVIAREDGGFIMVRDVPPADPFEYDANRLTGAIAMLRGLSLIDINGDWSLTPAGRAAMHTCHDISRHLKELE